MALAEKKLPAGRQLRRYCRWCHMGIWLVRDEAGVVTLESCKCRSPLASRTVEDLDGRMGLMMLAGEAKT